MTPTISLIPVDSTLPDVSSVKFHAATLGGVSYKAITPTGDDAKTNFAKIKKIALESIGKSVADAYAYEATVNYTTGIVTLKEKSSSKEYAISAESKDTITKEKICDLVRQGVTILKPAFTRVNIELASGLDTLHLSTSCNFTEYARLSTQSQDFKDALKRIEPALSSLTPPQREKYLEKLLFLHTAKTKATEEFNRLSLRDGSFSTDETEVRTLQENIKEKQAELEALETEKRQIERKIAEKRRVPPAAPADGSVAAISAEISALQVQIPTKITAIEAKRSEITASLATQNSPDHQAKIKRVEEHNVAAEYTVELAKMDTFMLAVAALHTDDHGNPVGTHHDIMETLKACKPELRSRRSWGVGMKESMSHLFSFNHGYTDDRLEKIAQGIAILRETSKSKRIATAHSHHAETRKEQPAAHLLMAIMKTYVQAPRDVTIDDGAHALKIKEHAHGLDGRLTDSMLNTIGKAAFNADLSRVHTEATVFD